MNVRNMQLEIRVVPNSGKFSVCLKDGIVKVHVRGKAEDNKANLELEKELSLRLGLRVAISRGARSRIKTLEIPGESACIRRKLLDISNIKR